MKKYLFLSVFTLAGIIISCQKENSTVSSVNSELTPENSSARAAAGLKISDLLDASKLISTYNDKDYGVDYTLYDARQNFLDDISTGDNIVQSITLFDDCHNGGFGLGVYTYVTQSKNLFYNYYKDLQSFNDNLPTDTFKVNDILINDIMYVRDIKFERCGVAVFFSDEWQEREYVTNYNDLRLESAIHAKVDMIDVEAMGCAWTPNCLRTSGNACRGWGCITIGCSAKRFETDLVERNYPNYIYYLTEVVLDEKYYDLRDEFLYKSKLGRKYSNIFFKMPDHFMETIDTDLIVDILAVLPSVNDAISNLLDPSFTGVIIDKRMESEINNLLSKSNNKSSSPVYQEALSILKTDFGNLVDKDKAEVYRIMDVKK